MAAHQRAKLISFGRQKKKLDDDHDDSYIPYNGPYEQPRSQKQRQRQRDSWGDPIDDDDDPLQQDDTVLADRQLYLRYADSHDSPNPKSVFDDQPRGRTRDQTFSGVSGRTMSSGGAVDPFSFRPHAATAPRRSTVSSTNPPLPPSLSAAGGVGESPIPVPRTSRDTRPDGNRVSLASIFSFGGLARKHGANGPLERDASPSRVLQRTKNSSSSLITKTLAKVHSRNNSTSDSYRGPLTDDKSPQPQVIHLTQPTTHAQSADTDDDEDYYSSHYAAARTPQRVTPPSDNSHHPHHAPQFNHSHNPRTLSRENSASTSTSSPRPHARPFPSGAHLHIPDPPQSATTDADSANTPRSIQQDCSHSQTPTSYPPPHPYQFHTRPNTPRSSNSADGIHTTYGMSCGLVRFTVPTKTLKSPSSTPNLRKPSQFPIARQATAPGSIPTGPPDPARSPSPFIGDDALLAPGTWYDALLNPRPKLKVKRDASRSRNNGDTPQGSSPLGQEVDFGPPLGADPAVWSQEYNRWRRHNASNLSPRSLSHSQSMGNLNKRQAPPPPPSQMRRDPSKGERPRSFAQDDLALPTPVPSLNHVLQEGRQLDDQRMAWKQQAATSLGNKQARNLARTRSKSLTSKGRKKGGHSHQTSMEYLAAQACLGNQNINLTPVINPPNFIMPKPGPVEYIAPTGPESSITAGPPPSNTRTGPSETLVEAPAPATRPAPSPTPSNLTESRIGIAISTPPLTSSVEAREGPESPYSFSHPYAHGGLSMGQGPGSNSHHSHNRQLSQGTAESAATSQASRTAHHHDPLSRHRLLPQLALHPYAASQDGDDNDEEEQQRQIRHAPGRDSYLDKHPMFGHYRSDSKVPQPSKMWAALSPDTVREILPGDLQYSPFLPEEKPLDSPGPGRTGQRSPLAETSDNTDGGNWRESIFAINDTAGVAEALVNATQPNRHQRGPSADMVGTRLPDSTASGNPPIPRVIEVPDVGPISSSSHRPMTRPTGPRPTMLKDMYQSSSDPSSNYTYGSSPIVLDDVREQEEQSLIIHEPPIIIPSPAITSETSSPSASPRVMTTNLLSDSEDLEQFKDLFYRPERDDSLENMERMRQERNRVLPKSSLPVTPSPPTTNISTGLSTGWSSVGRGMSRRWSEDDQQDDSDAIQEVDRDEGSSNFLQVGGNLRAPGQGGLPPSPALNSPMSRMTDQSERARSRITDGSLQFVFEGMPTPVATAHRQFQQQQQEQYSQLSHVRLGGQVEDLTLRDSMDNGLRGDFGHGSGGGQRDSELSMYGSEGSMMSADHARRLGKASDHDETIHPFTALSAGHTYLPEDVQSSRASSLMTGEDKPGWGFDPAQLGPHAS